MPWIEPIEGQAVTPYLPAISYDWEYDCKSLFNQVLARVSIILLLPWARVTLQANDKRLYYRIRFYILAVSCTRGLSADQYCILWVWCSPKIHCFWERTNWSILHFVFILLWIYIKWITVRTLFEEEYSWMCHWLRIFYVSWELLLGYKAKKIVGKFSL